MLCELPAGSQEFVDISEFLTAGKRRIVTHVAKQGAADPSPSIRPAQITQLQWATDTHGVANKWIIVQCTELYAQVLGA